MIAIIILLAVFALIAVRQVGGVRLQIWQIMLAGAAAALLTGQITPLAALASINPDVLLFLFGMFVVGEALAESGYLSHLSYSLFKKARSVDQLVLLVLFGMGIASAFLMNDTLAIIGTPVVLLLARKHVISPKLMMLALAFAVTIGSAMSPIGNPQNLLIAINGSMGNPFVAFFGVLFLPTMINLFVAYLLLKLLCRKDFRSGSLCHSGEHIMDRKLARLSKISLCIVVALVAAKIAAVFLGVGDGFRLTYIALIAALPILVFSERRARVLRKIDWHTLAFFAAMFVLMQSVWDSGFFQAAINGSGLDMASVPMILGISMLLSQLISNVPLVALYLPMLGHAGASSASLIALAVGSTIAGNMLILGAASNVIIIQNAEKRYGETITFREFARVGIPLAIANALVYWAFLAFV